MSSPSRVNWGTSEILLQRFHRTIIIILDPINILSVEKTFSSRLISLPLDTQLARMTKAICNLLLKQPPSPNLSQIEDGTTAFMGNSQDISDKTRLKWIKAISDMFFTRTELSSNSCVRDWNIILGLDGSVENIVDDIATPHAPEKKYPARYQLPSAISNSINTTETIHRAELFALGSILYQVISEKELFREMGSDEEDGETIQSLITEGKFPEDVWSLPMAPRILGCWCPEFAKKMLEANGKGKAPFSHPSALAQN